MKIRWMAGMVLALAAGVAAAAEPGAAARVNGEEISRARLQASVQALMQRQGMNFGALTDPGQYKALQNQVLEVLIGQELLWQDARDKGYVAAEEEVAEAVATVRGNFDTEQEFLNRIEQAGFDAEEFAADLKRQLSVRRYIGEVLIKEVSVSDAEVNEFYDSNRERMQQPEEVRARHILVKLDPKADAAADKAAREKIERVLGEAKGGADFAELAKSHSEGPSAPQGGDLGFFGPGRMVPPFEQAAFALQPGELSGVVRTQFGYHIIKAEERRGGGEVTREDAAGEIRNYLGRQRLQEYVSGHVAKLRESAEVEILAPM